MSKKKVLICEDEIESQTLIERILTKNGYDVYTSTDGRDSVDKTKEIKPDIVLLDIRMPKIDGLTTAKKIRAFDTNTKIIFITAFESPQLQQEASQYQISDYIIKPTSSEAIITAVQNALQV